MEEEKKNIITPSEYFENLKNSKQTLTPGKIKDSYGVILKLADKYDRIGQTRSLKRLKFLAEVLGEEEKLIDLGVTTFIYRDTIEDYVDFVADNVIKVIELRNYLREIPDEIVEVIEKTKDIFDEFYVVFTDYTGREERRVAQEKKDKDPILFGCFRNSEFVADRFYFLGDWTEEHCDLTLDKLVSEYKEKKNLIPTHTIDIPTTTEELVDALKKYEPVEDKKNDGFGDSLIFNRPLTSAIEPPKKSFFGKIRSIIKK